MAQKKRIMVYVPDALLEEVDYIVKLEKRNRSEFIREAMKAYLRERKRMEMREYMKNGYKDMAPINLIYAEMGMDVDFSCLKKYEEELAAECE
ncbi:CopG family ribbon-helix-helix protein [Paramaledivibacter caminithermalis]|jgi:CopG family transcriptional regulator/antitoxin EndoAI|uniref:Transcriptional regulator, CopG family n=1 Tax=Paramaledivibacter caminithermalis (strain DSM 15212 / CIP 107654 / DViRD3) TaxID=1121301 RepID=A0A1M6KS33_PARC5|nr:ribbon-helix-helix protein, CopG family [Paramaledivibacter caminithermalis]SHJ61778.1 transcriptional regulator, CopG family [Paramaledivibacter caminithermalis DSM 15212]